MSRYLIIVTVVYTVQYPNNQMSQEFQEKNECDIWNPIMFLLIESQHRCHTCNLFI